MTFVITTGGIDLSVGSTVALVNALAAILLQAACPGRSVVLADARARRLRRRSLQGWFVAYEGIPAFIVTLAGLSVLRGVALLLTQGYLDPDRADALVRPARPRLVPRRAAAGGASPSSWRSPAASR